MAKRPVIVHFHLFKNAGTSVDKVLEKNFGENWTEVEGPNNKKLTPEALVAFITDNPKYQAISSHTAIVSVPEMDDVEIVPIFFFRHPIDRIRSAYDFECKQDVQTPGALKAKEGDFKHYLDWRLSTITPWQVSEFHAFRLKDFHTFTPAKQKKLFLPRAKKALDSLPFVGLVEDFSGSMARMETYIQQYFPEFEGEDVHENTTSDRSLRLSQNIDKFKERIGEATFDQLVEANKIDFDLYEYVKSKLPKKKRKVVLTRRNRLPLVLVIGPHRSGTSFLTQVLSTLGFNLGKTLMLPSYDNPRGFWENQKIVTAHDDLIGSFKKDWTTLSGLPKKWEKTESAETAKKDIQNILQTDFDKSQPWLIKDPRLCFTLPIWKDISKQIGRDLKLLGIIRSPQGASQSIQERNHLSPEISQSIVVSYLQAMKENLSGTSTDSLVYESLVKMTGEEFFQTLQKALGKKLLQPNDNLIAQIDRLVLSGNGRVIEDSKIHEIYLKNVGKKAKLNMPALGKLVEELGGELPAVAIKKIKSNSTVLDKKRQLTSITQRELSDFQKAASKNEKERKALADENLRLRDALGGYEGVVKEHDQQARIAEEAAKAAQENAKAVESGVKGAEDSAKAANDEIFELRSRLDKKVLEAGKTQRDLTEQVETGFVQSQELRKGKLSSEKGVIKTKR